MRCCPASPLPLSLPLSAWRRWLCPSSTLRCSTTSACMRIVALGLVLLTGVGGLTSFGQAAFVGHRCLCHRLSDHRRGLPAAVAWLAIAWLAVAGLLLTAAVALLLGLLTLRLSGHYLPLGTIAWGMSPLLPVRQRLTSSVATPASPAFRRCNLFGRETRGWSRVLLPDLAGGAGCAIWRDPATCSTRGTGGRSARSRAAAVMAEAMGVDTAALEDGDLSRRRALRLRLRLAVRAPAALRQSDAFRPAHRHRVPVHGGDRAAPDMSGARWSAPASSPSSSNGCRTCCPKSSAHRGNFEVIVFGLLMIFVLQRAREGIWPIVLRFVPERDADA